MLGNYFKISWRNLVKQRTITFINLRGLYIGMGTALLIAFISIGICNKSRHVKSIKALRTE